MSRAEKVPRPTTWGEGNSDAYKQGFRPHNGHCVSLDEYRVMISCLFVTEEHGRLHGATQSIMLAVFPDTLCFL